MKRRVNISKSTFILTDDPRPDSEIISEFRAKRKQSQKNVKRKTDYKPRRKRKKKKMSKKAGYAYYLSKQMDRLMDRKILKDD